MTKDMKRPDECVWHPVWSKPHRKEMTLLLQRRFNEQAQESMDQSLGINCDETQIYYYAKARDIAAAHMNPKYAKGDLDWDIPDALEYFCDPHSSLYATSPIEEGELLVFAAEDQLRENTVCREEYSEENQCTLLITTAKPEYELMF